MLTLGDVLALCRRSADAFDHLPLPQDLADSIAVAAQAEGLSPTRYLRIAAAEFAHGAGAADWTRLLSRLRDSDDPARECVQVMHERRLSAPVELRED